MPAAATATETTLGSLADAWEGFVTAHRRARVRTRDAAHGPTLAQYELVRPLLDEDGMPVGRLADLAGVAAASATGMLDGLERASIVSRSRSSSDRRCVTVALTAAGRDQIERKHRDIDAKRRQFFAELAPSEREQTERTLRRLATLIGEL